MRRHRLTVLLPVAVVACLSSFCGGATEPGYVPRSEGEWEISSVEAEGLPASDVDALYRKAERLATLYSLLIVKNGKLVAERYFNGQHMNSVNPIASVGKSFISALTGIAVKEGVLASLDQRMAEFFPEHEGHYADPRKETITIRQILQMRSGYPWEEQTQYLAWLVESSNWIPFIVEIPLAAAPGMRFGYSNLMSHIQAIVLARAYGGSLSAFAEERLFRPLGMVVPDWPTDANGYHVGYGDIVTRARDLARFGQLYLDDGIVEGERILPEGWVQDSLRSYSVNVYGNRLSEHIRDIGYGFFWWSARTGKYRSDFAWGHGGNLVFVVQDLDLVIVTTADILFQQFGEDAWLKEKAIMDLVAEFIGNLPLNRGTHTAFRVPNLGNC